MNIIKHNWDWAHGLSKRQATDTIVIHHAAADNASPEAVHQWHKHNGWAGIGYHIYIRKDGSIHEGRPLWASGANVLNHNWHTIGVCCEGNYDVAGALMPKAQMDALHEVLRYLKSVYPNAAIKFHREFGGSVCPGRYFPAGEALNYNKESEDKDMDNPSNWAKEAWDWAKRVGITDGERPHDTATREEVITFLYRFSKGGNANG
jgi:hypothetical protein